MRRPEEAIELLAARPATAGLFLDFDGTLAPIVENPERARMPRELRPVLADLAGALGVLGVVSGRPAAFLAEQVDVAGVELLGLYGMQRWRNGRAETDRAAESWLDRVQEARGRLEDALRGADGVWVEDKGLSVAVHWRNAPDRDTAEHEVALMVAALAVDSGLRVEDGKFVRELRPDVEWDKGRVVRTLAGERGLAPVVFVGDDLGDLPAFAAAREGGGFAIAVSGEGETPVDLLEAADAVLPGPPAVRLWLGILRERLTGP
jgi:trehalose 6-phosphate phosphatase